MLRMKSSLFTAAWAPLCLLLAAPAASAQAEKPANVCRVYFTQAKPGMGNEFEAGRKRHVAFHKSINDTWSWNTYQVETGENAGSYSTVTCDHHWKDFDTWEQTHGDADGADAAKNLEPYSAGGSNSFYLYMSDVSSGGGAPGSAPLMQLIHFDVKIGHAQEFQNAVRKIHEAIQKTKWPSADDLANYHWYALADGGDGSHYVIVLPLKSWADMEDPETPFPAMLEKAFGRAEAREIFDALDSSVKHEYYEILRYRPALSYVPAR